MPLPLPGISPLWKIRSRLPASKQFFMEVEANNQLALQISQDTSVKVIDTLYTHSLTTSAGPAPSYLDMMRYDVSLIVDALK